MGNFSHNKRVLYLDIVRIIACLMVLLMHAPNFRHNEFADSFTYPIFINIINVCSKLFFMFSGAILIPITRPPLKFIQHRLLFIAIPFLVWSAIYFVEFYLVHDPTFYFIRRVLFSMPFPPI